MRGLLAVGLLLLAGCATPDSTDVTETAPPDASMPSDFTMEPGDGAHVLAGLKAFVDLAPQRFDNRFQHDLARDFLQQALADGGLNVTRETFTGPGQVDDPSEGQNLVATIPGRSNVTILVGAITTAPSAATAPRTTTALAPCSPSNWPAPPPPATGTTPWSSRSSTKKKPASWAPAPWPNPCATRRRPWP